jgi:hypothetical protein
MIDLSKFAGAALLASVLSIAVGLMIVAYQGNLRGLAAAFRGVEGIGSEASALSVMAKAGLVMTLAQIVGFGILAARLRGAGADAVATVSFGLVVFALAVSVLEGSFQGSVTAWAGQLWSATGSVPELYEALRVWVQSAQPVYVMASLVAMAGFGWAVLQTGLLAPWVGWVSVGWSLLWIVGYPSVGIPGIIVVYPIIYGIGLLAA